MQMLAHDQVDFWWNFQSSHYFSIDKLYKCLKQMQEAAVEQKQTSKIQTASGIQRERHIYGRKWTRNGR